MKVISLGSVIASQCSCHPSASMLLQVACHDDYASSTLTPSTTSWLAAKAVRISYAMTSTVIGSENASGEPQFAVQG